MIYAHTHTSTHDPNEAKGSAKTFAVEICFCMRFYGLQVAIQI